MKLSRIIICTQCYFAIVCGRVTNQRGDEVSLEMPSFTWDGEQSGFERLVITFPDGGEPDTALLQPSNIIPKPDGVDVDVDDSCIYAGNLENQVDAIVAVNGCPGSNNFDVIHMIYLRIRQIHCAMSDYKI